jgi:hypothetical protein
LIRGVLIAQMNGIKFVMHQWRKLRGIECIALQRVRKMYLMVQKTGVRIVVDCCIALFCLHLFVTFFIALTGTLDDMIQRMKFGGKNIT